MSVCARPPLCLPVPVLAMPSHSHPCSTATFCDPISHSLPTPPHRGNLEAFEGHFHRAKLPYQAKLVVDPCGHCQDAAAAFPHDTVFGRVILPILMGLDLIRDDDPNNSSYPAPPEGVGNVTIYVMSRCVPVGWRGCACCCETTRAAGAGMARDASCCAAVWGQQEGRSAAPTCSFTALPHIATPLLPPPPTPPPLEEEVLDDLLSPSPPPDAAATEAASAVEVPASAAA